MVLWRATPVSSRYQQYWWQPLSHPSETFVTLWLCAVVKQVLIHVCGTPPPQDRMLLACMMDAFWICFRVGYASARINPMSIMPNPIPYTLCCYMQACITMRIQNLGQFKALFNIVFHPNLGTQPCFPFFISISFSHTGFSHTTTLEKNSGQMTILRWEMTNESVLRVCVWMFMNV